MHHYERRENASLLGNRRAIRWERIVLFCVQVFDANRQVGSIWDSLCTVGFYSLRYWFMHLRILFCFSHNIFLLFSYQSVAWL
jgi:hypothetical protein